MKRNILLFVLFCFSLVLSGQNSYYNYQSTNLTRPNSAVSLQHSNGIVYFIQASTAEHKLCISMLDPVTMFPIGNDVYFTTGEEQFVLNGVFEGDNGKIVMYGYCLNSYSYIPFFGEVSYNLSNPHFYKYTNPAEGALVSGCAGKNQSNDIYLFVTHSGKLLTVNSNIVSTSLPIFNVPAIFPGLEEGKYIFTDVSKDLSNNSFIASGSVKNEEYKYIDLFYTYFDDSQSPVFTYNTIKNNVFYNTSVGKTLHTKISGEKLVVLHDLRFIYNSHTRDIIWLTYIKDFQFNPQITNSSFYLLPNAKFSPTDMLFDKFHNKLNILGEFNFCFDGTTQILAQTNPLISDPNIVVGQLGSGFSGSYCTNYQFPEEPVYNNDLKLFNFAQNIPHNQHPVLIAGCNKAGGILTNTYDILQSSCDNFMSTEIYGTDPQLSVVEIENSHLTMQFTFVETPSYEDNVSRSVVCNDANYFLDDLEVKSLQNNYINLEATAQILILQNKSFVCNGFSEEIHYSVYDVTGKMLQQGVTQNNKTNRLGFAGQLAIIKAIDKCGNVVITKIIL